MISQGDDMSKAFYIATKTVSVLGAILFVLGSMLIAAGAKEMSKFVAYGFLSCGAYLVVIQIVRRPCGHGAVSQGIYGIKWPFIINKCPKCGEDIRSKLK
jgi:hypothetical protein